MGWALQAHCCIRGIALARDAAARLGGDALAATKGRERRERASFGSASRSPDISSAAPEPRRGSLCRYLINAH